MLSACRLMEQSPVPVGPLEALGRIFPSTPAGGLLEGEALALVSAILNRPTTTAPTTAQPSRTEEQGGSSSGATRDSGDGAGGAGGAGGDGVDRRPCSGGHQPGTASSSLRRSVLTGAERGRGPAEVVLTFSTPNNTADALLLQTAAVSATAAIAAVTATTSSSITATTTTITTVGGPDPPRAPKQHELLPAQAAVLAEMLTSAAAAAATAAPGGGEGRQQLQGGRYMDVCLIGPRGEGKTTVARQFAAALGYVL